MAAALTVFDDAVQKVGAECSHVGEECAAGASFGLKSQHGGLVSPSRVLEAAMLQDGLT